MRAHGLDPLMVVTASVLLAACGTTASPAAGEATTEEAQPATVFAAASLNEVFPEIAQGLSPEPKFSFDGSSGLVDQLRGGASADVFASADEANMIKAQGAGVIEGEPVAFATNHLVLVTPPGNPAGVTGFDGSLAGIKLVVCAPEVPCGAATLALASAQGRTLQPVSEESKVTDVLGKVTSGEADAGLVYATDASDAGNAVQTFEIPGTDENPNTYWIAQVKDAPNPAGAKAFIDEVMGEGQAVLHRHGFGPSPIS